MQGVIPMVHYEDGEAAMDWLAEAFGFHEITRMLGDQGNLAHGEMETGHGIIMLASATPDYESPKHHRETCEAARKWSKVPWVIDGVLVLIDNVDEHFSRANEAGARILSEPEVGPPGKRYRVEDIEGHRWMFLEAKKEDERQ